MAKTKKEAVRFSKKGFGQMMTEMLNDPEFKDRVVKKVDKTTNTPVIEDVLVSNGFRKFCKGLVEKFGVDKKESEKIMTADFKFGNTEALYDFFTAALYNYLKKAGKFDLPMHEDLKASLILREVEGKTKKTEARNPANGQSLGTVEVKTKAHKELRVKSSTPVWLSEKRKIK